MYNRSNLFLESFNAEKFQHKEFLNYLLEQIKISEENLKENLEQIRNDFPNLTDHSLRHSLMLWNYASLIIDDDEYLNPLEAYILHMCFLIHDAGMCFSILNNKLEIENSDTYKDFIALNPNLVDVEYEALFYCIRKIHGEYALDIASKKLSSGKMVIECEYLRDEFSEIIGKISKSHSCAVSYIENELSIYTSPKYLDLPVDSPKLAYILRVSDAAHIDNLRTPLTNTEIVNNISGISKEHWLFQNKIGFPSVDAGFIVYRANSSFSKSEKRAWWLCYEALKVLDNELKKAEIYFLETSKKGFAVKGVKSIDNTLDLGNNYIKTIGWKSIDTKIKVSNPKHLAANVGGKNLYSHSYIAVREMIQNCIDAIHLRSIRSSGVTGLIDIRLYKKGNEYYLSIADNGIGMSKNILTNQLLDFGASYWKTFDFYDEFVGMARKNFEPIGKFGIGFFSIFMLGEEVEVTSVRFGDSFNHAYKLKFENGLLENPLLIDNVGAVTDYGTEIVVKLSTNPYKEKGFIYEFSKFDPKLSELVRYLVPSSPYQINIVELDKSMSIFANLLNDNTEHSIVDFLDRISTPKTEKLLLIMSELRKSYDKLLPIYNVDKKVIGQLAILPKYVSVGVNDLCVVMCNGIRVSSLQNLIGYIKVDVVTNLNRTQFISNISYDSVVDWCKRYTESINVNPNIHEEVNNLKFSLNILEQDVSILIYIKNKESMVLINRQKFVELLKVLKEIKLYYLVSKVDSNYNYDGFVFLLRNSNITSIVSDKDKDKLNTEDNFIMDNLKNIWGNFESEIYSGDTDFAMKVNNYFDMPYLSKKVYRKIEV